MISINIDPGNKESAYVVMQDNNVLDKGIVTNDLLVNIAKTSEYDVMNIEIVANMGLSGVSLYDTSEMVGILCFICLERERALNRFKRHSIKKHMKVRGRHKVDGKWVKPPSSDSQIRTSLIKKYGEVGTKANKGYFYGFKSHMWQAMAVYETWKYGNVASEPFMLGEKECM